MYQTPSPNPSRRPRKRRSNRRKIAYSRELLFAALLTIAVAVGLIAAGGSGRPIEVAVLLAAAAAALLTGWPASGHAALGAAAAYLILETVFGRLDTDHVTTQLVLTAGTLGAVLATGLSHKDSPARKSQARPANGNVSSERWVDPWADELPGSRRLIPGTLDYEIERARRSETELSVLAVRPDEVDFLAAAGGEPFAALLDLLDDAIEGTVRAIDLVSRSGTARFEVVLPETGAEGARTVAERIRLRIDSTRPELTPGRVVGISVSVGVASYPADGKDDVELSAAAARALARAAELGGNRTVMHSLPAGAPKGWAISSRP